MRETEGERDGETHTQRERERERERERATPSAHGQDFPTMDRRGGGGGVRGRARPASRAAGARQSHATMRQRPLPPPVRSLRALAGPLRTRPDTPPRGPSRS